MINGGWVDKATVLEYWVFWGVFLCLCFLWFWLSEKNGHE